MADGRWQGTAGRAPSRVCVRARTSGGIALLSAACALLAPALPAQQPAAGPPSTFEEQLRENQRRLEAIRRERGTQEQELERLRSRAHSLTDELANIDRQRRSTTRIRSELDRQIVGLSGEIDNTTTGLTLAEDALAEKHAVLERRLVDIVKRGPLFTFQVLLTAETFGELLSRYKYLYLVSRQDRQLADDLARLRSRVRREQGQLVQARDVLAQRRSERDLELERYARLERERQRRLRATRQSEEEVQRQLARLERDERRLTDLIEALDRTRREAEARGLPPRRGAITTADLGRLAWPVDGRILYQFGTDIGPNNTRIPRHGIGIAAPPGTPVRVVAPGTVAIAERLGLYLLCVLVDHGGGYYSFYAYLKDAAVRRGDVVTRGQVIGTVGGESSDEGPHLHFEIRGQGGVALDPTEWLRSQP
jgi:septal ring factor EnvC (AmiA/AmiB activator)